MVFVIRHSRLSLVSWSFDMQTPWFPVTLHFPSFIRLQTWIQIIPINLQNVFMRVKMTKKGWDLIIATNSSNACWDVCKFSRIAPRESRVISVRQGNVTRTLPVGRVNTSRQNLDSHEATFVCDAFLIWHVQIIIMNI